MTAAAQGAGARSLGVFPVRVEAGAVAGFAAALGRSAPADTPETGASVPLTFPLRWFSDPAIRAALVSAALPATPDAPAMLPVHIEQRIALSEPLRIGADYRLALSVEGPDARRMLRVSAVVSDAQGASIGSLGAGFLLVSTEGGAASGPMRR